MGLTRILAVYCTCPMMVGVEMEAKGALLKLFPHEAEGEVKATREKSHAHRLLSAFAPAWLPPARGVNSSFGQMVLLSGTCGHLIDHDPPGQTARQAHRKMEKPSRTKSEFSPGLCSVVLASEM
jgi:hypothetical protein